jgi:hypothetical protein
MLVSIAGFGSLWRSRFNKNPDDAYRFARGVFYNTTGVEIAGTIRQRPRITGYARFNACGGFDPHHPSRMIGWVFECAEPCVWEGNNKLVFERVLPAPEEPDRFLVVVRSRLNGVLSVGTSNWRCRDTWLIAFSESAHEQEAMLLMPACGWIRTSLGHFVLEPEIRRPWIARLAFVSPDQE